MSIRVYKTSMDDKSNGYETSGTSIEHYYTDPDFTENKQVTMIKIPLK